MPVQYSTDGSPAFQGRFVKTADQVLTAAFADVAQLSAPVLPNISYIFEFHLLMDATLGSTGMDVAVNGPAAPVSIAYEQVFWSAAAQDQNAAAAAYDADTSQNSANGPTPRWYIIKGTLRNGANAGMLTARAKKENVAGVATVRAGSYGLVVSALN